MLLSNSQGITGISISGYKSLYEDCNIEVRPLTILAGANSSGKSSIMQPLLLLKQTLEATYDPGALLIYGSHVKFTLATQLLSQVSEEKRTDFFTIKIDTNFSGSFKSIFKNQNLSEIELIEENYYLVGDSGVVKIVSQVNNENVISIPQWILNIDRNLLKIERGGEKPKWFARRNRCFFDLDLRLQQEILSQVNFSDEFQKIILKLLYVPALRGNPERTYNTTAIGSEYPGNFENYVASIVNQWQKTKDTRIKELEKYLATLGLTWKVETRQVNNVQIELRVGRLPRSSGIEDMVNIADVGFGVSQVLPVLVALIVAEPGQLVYLEQPEIHLHPRAQVALAEVLTDAANQGVRVVVETHSELLLLAVQSLVAEGKLLPELVKLHWFKRREDGVTEISSAELDEAGAFGNWPEDFSDVSLKLENRYLNAAESHLWKR